MKYPKPEDRYSCEVFCENFMEIENRLQEVENNGGGGGSSEADWNVNDENASGYIKNRTHYAIPLERELVTCNYDGNQDGKSVVYFFSGPLPFVKISEDTPDITDFVGCTQTNTYRKSNGETETYSFVLTEEYATSSENVFDLRFGDYITDGYGLMFGQQIVIIYERATTFDGRIMTPGIWVADDSTMGYLSQISYYSPAEEIHTLDPKYIPNTIARSREVETLIATVNQLTGMVGELYSKIQGLI